MYSNSTENKFSRCWIIGTTLGLTIGVIAGFSSSVLLYDLSYLRAIINFWCGAIIGLCLGFFQALALAKLLKEKKLSTSSRTIIIKWISATIIGMSVGVRITSLFSNLGSVSPVTLVLHILLIFMFLSLAQGLMMKWHIKTILQWLIANVLSVLGSALVGVFLYFLSVSIVVPLTGGGLGALLPLLIIAPLLISLSSGLIYGAITGLYLPSLLNDI